MEKPSRKFALLAVSMLFLVIVVGVAVLLSLNQTKSRTLHQSVPYIIINGEEFLAAIGIDGTAGYIRRDDYEMGIVREWGRTVNSRAKAVEFNAWLDRRLEEMKNSGEAYVVTMPLYSDDGITVIGEFGISVD